MSPARLGHPPALADAGEGRTEKDLARHACINWHPAVGATPYRWEFTEDGHDLTVSFEARVVTNDIPLIVRFARAGVGLAMVFEEVVRPLIQRGEVVEVLREFSTPFLGFYLYYPSRRTASPPLRALIDHLLHLRQTA